MLVGGVQEVAHVIVPVKGAAAGGVCNYLLQKLKKNYMILITFILMFAFPLCRPE